MFRFYKGNSSILKDIYGFRCEMETISFIYLCMCTSTYIILTFFHSADYVFSTEDYSSFGKLIFVYP